MDEKPVHLRNGSLGKLWPFVGCFARDPTPLACDNTQDVNGSHKSHTLKTGTAVEGVDPIFKLLRGVTRPEVQGWVTVLGVSLPMSRVLICE